MPTTTIEQTPGGTDAIKKASLAQPGKNPAPANPPGGKPGAGQTPPANLPAGNTAATLAVQSGGNKGGRGRADRLVPGSPEAAQADRERDAKRKRDARKFADTQRVPEPLPSRAVSTAGQITPVGSDPFGVPPVIEPPVTPWSREMVTPAVLQSIALLQELEQTYVEKKLAAANIPVSEWKELLAMAKWPELATKGLSDHGADMGCRVLNAIGIDSKYKDVLNVCPSAISLILSRIKFYKRLDEVIAAANVQVPVKK